MRNVSLSIIASTPAILLLLLCGCGKKEMPVAPEPPTPEIAPPIPSTDAVDIWTRMETLSPDKWSPIEGAQNIEWDPQSAVMRIDFGTDLNGVRWNGKLPVTPYTIELEARRVSGSDFFCGLTFPVRTGSDHVSLILGGWGGSLVGISSIDGMDASENSTGTQYHFEEQRWYRIRVEVRQEHIQAWIDDEQIVDAHTEEQRLSLRPGPIEDCAPLGIATWNTKAEFRDARWKPLEK
jgi:hypothetical protein